MLRNYSSGTTLNCMPCLANVSGAYSVCPVRQCVRLFVRPSVRTDFVLCFVDRVSLLLMHYCYQYIEVVQHVVRLSDNSFIQSKLAFELFMARLTIVSGPLCFYLVRPSVRPWGSTFFV